MATVSKLSRVRPVRTPTVNTCFNKFRSRAPVRLALTALDHPKAQGQNSKPGLPRERVKFLSSQPSPRCLPAPASKACSPAPVSPAPTALGHPKVQGQNSKTGLLEGYCVFLPSSDQRRLPAPVSKARSPKTPVGLELILLDNQKGQGSSSKKALVIGGAVLRPGERRLLASPVPMAIVPVGKPAQRTIQNSTLTERSLAISKPLDHESSVPTVEEIEEHDLQDQTDLTVAEPKKSLWQTVTQPKVLKVAGVILGVAAMVALGGVVAASYYAPIVTFAQTPAVVQAGNFVAHYTTHQLVPAAAQAGRFVALNTHKLLIAPGFENALFFTTMAMHTAIIPALKTVLPIVFPVISTMIISTLAAYLVLCVANRVWGAVKGAVWSAGAAVVHAFERELDKTYVGRGFKALFTTAAAPIYEMLLDAEDSSWEMIEGDKKEEAVPQSSLGLDESEVEEANQENALVETTHQGKKPQRSLANRVASYALWAVVIAGGAYLYSSRGNAGLNQLPVPQPLPVPQLL